MKAGVLGLTLLIFVPALSVILLITMFGWSLSILLMLLLAFAALIATVPEKLLAGEMIYSKIFKKEAGKMIYYLTGAVVFAIVYEISFPGRLIKFIALLVGLGALGIWISKKARPKS